MKGRMDLEGSAGHHSSSSPAASFYRCEQRGPELKGNLSRQARSRPLIRIYTSRSATGDKRREGYWAREEEEGVSTEASRKLREARRGRKESGNEDATFCQAWRGHRREEEDSFSKNQMNMDLRLVSVKVKPKWGRGRREADWGCLYPWSPEEVLPQPGGKPETLCSRQGTQSHSTISRTRKLLFRAV